jgi:hypothetical protein
MEVVMKRMPSLQLHPSKAHVKYIWPLPLG